MPQRRGGCQEINASLSKKPRQTSLELVIYNIHRRLSRFKGLAPPKPSKTRRDHQMHCGEGKGIWIHLEQMTEAPGPYTMSYGFNLDALCLSIKKVGVIHPPLVARNQEGSFDIVSGYRRIRALKALGERQTLCHDVTARLSSPLERLLAGFYENLATRKFNDIEKAMVLARLGEHMTREEILESYMPLLSLPSHDRTMTFFLKLLNLDRSIQAALAEEEISIHTAKALVEMEVQDRQPLFFWIHELNLNFNQQLKFIEYTKDISIRENVELSGLLFQELFVSIKENQRLNTPQKAKAVLEALRARRFPRLTLAQQAVERKISAISLPHGARIHYDPNLENPYYHLEISFRQGEELKKTINALQAMHELEPIPELWPGQ
jgi:ParB family chromosome partitioning protein